ncbi:MAG: hypothetical protein IKN12_04110 [Selenomonadaceae bacterium]|nr:hypothetical protein [Selenomonadaceae bacterium]
MRISTKHSNHQVVEYRDFSGGLNTSNASEMIAHNELAKAINVEIDKSTGLLKTVPGTKTLYESKDKDFTDIFYDKINDVFIVCDSDKNIYGWDGEILFEISAGSKLSGNIPPTFCLWESGVLIASGGKLQYCKRDRIETMSNSPAECNGVFVRDGRVWVYAKDRLYTSAVGDEESWATNPNDSSSGQWLDIGYKDGGNIVGVVSLSSDIIIVKDNGHVFRLSGSYPNWVVKEISREVSCRGYRASVGLINNAVILGDSFMQAISTTEEYGDMQARDISIKVRNEISLLPKTIKLRYVAPYNQIWILDNDRRLLFLELDNNAFFEREYTTTLKDVCYKGNDVYVLKKDKIQIQDPDSVFDEDFFLNWRWRAKTLVSNNAYLVKRVRVDITPICDHHFECRFLIGKAEVFGTHQNIAACGYQDYMPAYLDSRDAYAPPVKVDYVTSDDAFMYNGYGYEDETPGYSLNMFRTDVRLIERLRKIKVESWGRGGQLLFNGVNFEVAEV